MTGWTPDEEDDIALAAEYVVGLLEGEELRTFETRLAAEPALRLQVDNWAEDLVVLTDGIMAVLPPHGGKQALMRRLFPEAQRRPRWTPDRLWAGLLSGAAVAALAVWLVNPALLGGGGEPDYTARIAAENGSLVIEARFDADTQRLELERTAGVVPEDGDYELWLLQGEEVRSLGVLPREATGVIEVRAELVPTFQGGSLAVSEEPLGGSPTGQPGPVVAVASITEL
jgi:anti-sigma-K factor RskA